MSGVELIAAERRRQMEVEGWTQEHDDEHADGDLSRAAVTYAKLASHQAEDPATSLQPCPNGWPWSVHWWKPSDDPVRNLVKAGALIAAEIDRLTRQKQQF